MRIRKDSLATGALFLALCVFAALPANGAVLGAITWNLPTAHADATPISASLQATIETRLYYSRDATTWTLFAVVPNGGKSWTGPFPLAEGVQGYYSATASIPSEGTESAKSEPVPYPPLPEGALRSSTVVLDNCSDTYVNRGIYSNNGYSTQPLIRTYTWPDNNAANRGFATWDLSSLPPGIAVTNATLQLYYVDEDGSGGDEFYTVGVSRVTGVTPAIAECNWNTFDGITPWTGGRDGGNADIAPAESSAEIGRTRGWISWDVTKMVQDWVASPETNRGMAIDSDRFAKADSNRSFASSEYPDPALRPKLVVTYGRRIPVTTTVSLDNCSDTYVNLGAYANNGYSAKPLIRTYTWPDNNVANRGYMKWDLSSLQGEITVTSAALRLYHVAEGAGGGDDLYTVSVAKVMGIDPDLSLCTWNTCDGFIPWTGGEDGGAADLAVAESAVGIGKMHGWVTWDVTQMVQEWIAAPETNRGMAIDADNFASSDSNRYFCSREYPDPALRPRLDITYQFFPK